MRCSKRLAWLRFPAPRLAPIGEGYLRFSVANSMENLMEALKRIDAWTKANL